MKTFKSKIKFILSSSVLVCILTLIFTLTSFAISKLFVSVDNNKFETGYTMINLNDGESIIDENDGLYLEPGMIIRKNFFIENTGSEDLWYKLYFSEVSESFIDDLVVVTIENEDSVIYRGKISELKEDSACVSNSVLKTNERHNLSMEFYLLEGTGNEAQGQRLSFILTADAVQAKNNPEKKFN